MSSIPLTPRRSSEVDLPTYPGEAGVHHRGWSPPGRPKRLDIPQGDVRVHHVEDVDSDLCPAAPVAQNFRDTEIDLVDPVAKDRLRCDEVDGHAAGAA